MFHEMEICTAEKNAKKREHPMYTGSNHSQNDT